MNLSRIQEEQNIQVDINACIDKYINLKFNAGAGAGKTYALIESLKYIINEYGDKMEFNNQKIICITYTNVATAEIKDRIGNSELVKISTIHERLWDLIKDYKKELLQIHTEKLEEELKQLRYDINDNSMVNQFEKYRMLTVDQKKQFQELMLKQKDLFYKSYDKAASDFKKALTNLPNIDVNMLSNVANFKKIVTTIYKIDNYVECLKKINNKDTKYSIVKYEARFNSDILHKMIISHDTLIEYALKIIKRYDLLKRIIIDRYPYILIDEYQDTNEEVVKIMKTLDDFANQIKHELFIGYFGDTAQNIYDNGIGGELDNIHPGLKEVNKRFNRRSHEEIIEIINLIRNDHIKQVSIFENHVGGSVKFYTGSNDDKMRFIEKYKTQWQIRPDNKLHCLLLTNKLVSEFSGFMGIYNCFAKTDYYKVNYDQLNTELLSSDLTKLGTIPKLLYNLIKLKNDIEMPQTPLSALFDKNRHNNLTFSEIKDTITLLKSIGGATLNNYIESIFKLYHISDNKILKEVIEKVISIERYSYSGFYNHLLVQLNPNAEDEKIEDAKSNLNELLSIDIVQYNKWMEFINDDQKTDTEYHTYHGTKGEEYDNVVIIMENDFGNMNRNKFSSFFGNRNTPPLDGSEKTKFENTKNLLYVSCSRAIKNLRILYLDDTTSFNTGIKEIFGEIYNFE